MARTTSGDAEAPARMLALILAADGAVDERTLDVLDRLNAFVLLGVGRRRFIELAAECVDKIDRGLSERSWLSDDDIAFADAVAECVCEPAQRVLVCRLAAAAIEDDGLVTHGSRLAFEHALAHWHIEQAAVSRAGRPIGGR
jgi:hypothetical protein